MPLYNTDLSGFFFCRRKYSELLLVSLWSGKVMDEFAWEKMFFSNRLYYNSFLLQSDINMNSNQHDFLWIWPLELQLNFFSPLSINLLITFCWSVYKISENSICNHTNSHIGETWTWRCLAFLLETGLKQLIHYENSWLINWLSITTHISLTLTPPNLHLTSTLDCYIII